MGANDWASQAATKMRRHYGVSNRRALQITDRVRKVVANSEIRTLEEAGLLDEKLVQSLIDDLIGSLDKQDEESLEGRWNALIKECGLYGIIGPDVLLYNPAEGDLDPEEKLIADDGDSITIREAMLTAWWDSIPIEPTDHGIRLGGTKYTSKSNLTLADWSSEKGFNKDVIDDQLSRDLRRNRLVVDSDLLVLTDLDRGSNSQFQYRVRAIASARRFIIDNRGATGDEILTSLSPAGNHPLSLGSDQARVLEYRAESQSEWLYEIIVPGLRLLSDLVEPVHRSGQWLPRQVLVGGFESEGTVEKILSNGYLFEIAYKQGNDEKRFVVYHQPITRPSAKPLRGPPVFLFKRVTDGGSIKIRLPDLREIHPIPLKQLPTPIWNPALSNLVDVADTIAQRVPRSDLKSVLGAVRYDEIEEVTGLEFVVLVLREREELREEIGDDLEAMLLKRLNLLSEPEQSEEIACCLGILAEVAPERVLDAVPAMASAVDSAPMETRRWIVYGFSHIAEEYPEELLPVVNELSTYIEESDDNLQVSALAALGKIADEYPNQASEVVVTLGRLLSSDVAMIRANSTGLLADIAQSEPESVITLASELATALGDDDEQTRVHASIALNRAGEANPHAIREEREQLIAGLNDSNAAVRANVCTLIGNAEAPVPVSELRPLENDPDELVREQAKWAISRIS